MPRDKDVQAVVGVGGPGIGGDADGGSGGGTERTKREGEAYGVDTNTDD